MPSASSRNGHSACARRGADHDQPGRDRNQQRHRGGEHEAPRDAVDEHPRRDREQEDRRELEQADQPEVEGVVANRVNLPADRDGDHLLRQVHRQDHDHEQREIAAVHGSRKPASHAGGAAHRRILASRGRAARHRACGLRRCVGAPATQESTSARSVQAAATASARECTPSFFSTFFTWLLTVSGER